MTDPMNIGTLTSSASKQSGSTDVRDDLAKVATIDPSCTEAIPATVLREVRAIDANAKKAGFTDVKMAITRNSSGNYSYELSGGQVSALAAAATAGLSCSRLPGPMDGSAILRLDASGNRIVVRSKRW